jgi:hypothetical protein
MNWFDLTKKHRGATTMFAPKARFIYEAASRLIITRGQPKQAPLNPDKRLDIRFWRSQSNRFLTRQK